MTVVFDLDDTLLDTVRLKRDLAFADADEIVLRSAEYLFPDALPVLERLRTEGCRLFLLTYGPEAWQRSKVRHAGLESRFDGLLFTETPKRDIADELRALDPPLVFVNDNGAEIDDLLPKLPDARFIAVRGPKPPPAAPGIPVCESLEEVCRAITETFDN